MDLDQAAAEVAERLHADRSIVQKGPRPPVRKLDAAQDQAAVGFEVLGSHDIPRRVVRRKIEHGRDLALLLALPHGGPVAAPAKRQSQGIEQDRLARTGLSGQHRQTRPELQVEPVDQDEVANAKLCEHGPGL